MNRRELLLALPALVVVAGCSGGGATTPPNPQIAELITRLTSARALWLEQNTAFKWYRMRVRFASEVTGQVWEIRSEVFNPSTTPTVVSATPELTTGQITSIFEQFSTIERIYDYYIGKAQQLLTNPNVESYNVTIDLVNSVPTSEELVLKTNASSGQLNDRIWIEGYQKVTA